MMQKEGTIAVAAAENNRNDNIHNNKNDISNCCVRCGNGEGVSTADTHANSPTRIIHVRGEALCISCFQKYFKSKVVKRLEALRTTFFAAHQHQHQHQHRTSSSKHNGAIAPAGATDGRLNVLLALSSSPQIRAAAASSSPSPSSSSMVLLDVLSEYLDQQVARSRRAAFAVHVCHVYLPSTNTKTSTSTSNAAHTASVQQQQQQRQQQKGAEEEKDKEKSQIQAWLDELKERYPKHTYSLLSPLSSISSQAADSTADAGEEEDLDDIENDGNGEGRVDKLTKLLASLKSPTSRADIAQSLLATTVAEAALARGCEAVLWGDSTTRLAEKILAHTAKGRGASLPWLVNDCRSPYRNDTTSDGGGGLVFGYPMRDLLHKEISSFARFASPPLPLPLAPSSANSTATLQQQQQWDDEVDTAAAKKFVVNSKTASIDALMQDYFRSVEHEYPNIVANVVRTTSKLQLPATMMTMMSTDASPHGEEWRLCEVCSMPLLDCRDPNEQDEHNDDDENDNNNDDAVAENGTHKQTHDSGERSATTTMCYGCKQSILGGS